MKRILGLLIVAACFACTAKEMSSGETRNAAATEKKATEEKKMTPAPEKKPAAEADYIKVQHCLIGFKGSVPGKSITRTKEEAEKLANELFERAKRGEDFDAIVKEHTNDAHPGIYGMSNTGKSAKPGYYQRGGMVPAFGDVGFPLQVGEVGLAAHDPKKSPYGWHIIKRVE